ncbi:hypothetical protein BH20ACI3_BH20ACI3_40860 [soil metagenome]
MWANSSRSCQGVRVKNRFKVNAGAEQQDCKILKEARTGGLDFVVATLSFRSLVAPTLVGWISVPEPEDYGDFATFCCSGARFRVFL